jgi:DNA-binding IclR family transcriptional regulator
VVKGSAATEDGTREGPINRTLNVLSTICETGPQTLTSLSQRTGLTPPTLLRILRIMREEGFVTQDDNRQWRATMTVWRLGSAVLQERGYGIDVDRVLRSLSSTLDETVVYATYADGWISYIAEAEPPRIVRTSVPIGGRFSPFDTVTGRVILADLDSMDVKDAWDRHRPKTKRATVDADLAEIRERGYAVGEGGGAWPGVWAAAHVVADRVGPLGAVAVVYPASRKPDDVRPVVAALGDAADRLVDVLGGRRR